MDKKIDVDLVLLQDSLRYEASTGDLFWKGGSQFRNKKHVRAGWLGSNGYRNIKLRDKTWLVHVLVWVLHNGLITDPALEVDHINRDPLDNRIENLRLVTRKQNQANTKRYLQGEVA